MPGQNFTQAMTHTSAAPPPNRPLVKYPDSAHTSGQKSTRICTHMALKSQKFTRTGNGTFQLVFNLYRAGVYVRSRANPIDTATILEMYACTTKTAILMVSI